MTYSPAEIALARDLQQAALAARKRTGLRIGLNVERGRYNLIVTKQRSKRGAWDVIYLQSGLTADEALNSLRMDRFLEHQKELDR
jgi:hypothetical protein